MVALRSFYADDPAQDAADIAAAERDIARLRYAEPKDAEHAERIQAALDVHERHLARMRAA